MFKITNPYFLKYYLPFTLLVVAGLKIIQYLRPALLVARIWVVFGFFWGLTPLVYFLAWQGIKKGGPESALVLLGSTVLRMVISLALALIFIIKFKDQATIFAADFFVLYILFAVFEIHCLLHNLRLPKKENNTSNK